MWRCATLVPTVPIDEHKTRPTHGYPGTPHAPRHLLPVGRINSPQLPGVVPEVELRSKISHSAKTRSFTLGHIASHEPPRHTTRTLSLSGPCPPRQPRANMPPQSSHMVKDRAASPSGQDHANSLPTRTLTRSKVPEKATLSTPCWCTISVAFGHWTT